MSELRDILETHTKAMTDASESVSPSVKSVEIGKVETVIEGIVRLRGLEHVRFEELVELHDGTYGMVFDLSPDEVAVIMLDEPPDLKSGMEAKRTHRVLDIPVGNALLGRVIDPLGRPLDGKAPVKARERMAAERPAPQIMDRSPVTEPLQTGILAVDALVPIGRGQRELIIGDRQTGKTGIAVDTIINQRKDDVICIYCAIAQRSTALAKVVDELEAHDAMDYSIVVATSGDDPPGLHYVAPYAATSMAEYFMEKGKDVLVVYDDLTRHARSYRELSLLLRRPPAREAYPGDIFYIHSRLLERATHLDDEHGGGSLTALPIIETEEQNISAYIPTNLISITDGQVYLSPRLYQQGVLPPVDVGRSVSRVGGKTQLPAYRSVAGDLRLIYSQFEELENFSRFGVQLDEETQRTLERGRRLREVLKQRQYAPIPVIEQIGLLVAVTEGLLDDIPIERIADAKEAIREAVRQKQEIAQKIADRETLEESTFEALRNTIADSLQALERPHGAE